MILIFFIVLIILLASTLLLAVHFRKSEKQSNVNNEGMRRVPKKSSPKSRIFFHEDFFCQVQLLPFENAKGVEQEAKVIEEFATNNFNGNGFKNAKVREASKVPLNSRGIRREDLDMILESMKVDKHVQVSTGYGSHEEISRNTTGYGSNGSAVYYNFSNDNVFQNIWFINIRSFESDKMASVLNQIGSKWNLLLADWDTLEFVDLKIPTMVEKYLEDNQSEEICTT